MLVRSTQRYMPLSRNLPSSALDCLRLWPQGAEEKVVPVSRNVSGEAL